MSQLLILHSVWGFDGLRDGAPLTTMPQAWSGLSGEWRVVPATSGCSEAMR